MYYLGQAIVIEDQKIPGIFLGKDAKNDVYWIFHLYPEDTREGEDEEEHGDEFTYKLDQIQVIHDSPNKYEHLKDLPITECLFRGDFCTDKLHGSITDEYVNEDRIKIIQFLKKLEAQSCFVKF